MEHDYSSQSCVIRISYSPFRTARVWSPGPGVPGPTFNNSHIQGLVKDAFGISVSQVTLLQKLRREVVEASNLRRQSEEQSISGRQSEQLSICGDHSSDVI